MLERKRRLSHNYKTEPQNNALDSNTHSLATERRGKAECADVDAGKDGGFRGVRVLFQLLTFSSKQRKTISRQWWKGKRSY